MTIHINLNFWVWLCRFAFRRAMEAPAVPVGLPGHRDTQAKCEFYYPARGRYQYIGRCAGDGHYLCQECCHLDKGGM